MSRVFSLRQQWLGNVRGDVLAGIVVALALIPEAIAFSIIAGVDPKVGLYAAFCIAVVTSIAGGRPGMISAATGAMALLMVDLVKEHGLQYLLAATVLAGLLQLIAAALRLGALMRFVSRSVITGFVNALAILIFLAQLPELVGMPWPVHAVCAAGLAIIYLLPRFTTAIPSPLVAIVVLTAVCAYWHIDIRNVGDMGRLPDSLPVFLLPDVPLTWDSVRILLPVSTTLAVVGLLESLMTAQIVEDLTDTPSQRNRECAGQGLANLLAGCFGGMAGCAMIGQSVINVRSGGRGRLSCLVAGVVLLLMVVYGAPWVRQIPMAALVAVMIMVSIGTFSWGSLRDLRTHPGSSSVVMLGTVVVTVWTHDLARGVLAGVLLSALFFARKVGRMLQVEASERDDGVRVYAVRGQVFFASAGQFVASFDFPGTPPKVLIDLSHAHFWDISAVAALDRVVLKLRAHGAEVEVIGVNQASDTLIETLGTHRRDGARLQLGH
ncbi:SulP family inorganic anion transporter [Xanthomonas arboricola]|uniref:SulP family inorganic anion transporter n=2 Tax=Xanthomonas arboricola pv. pruni TaxID=69929 RepID=A0AAP4KAW9_9XANT|nr:SulP family inorganic anion transporter [Xanthomonas arboricola]MDN0267034.1 SulP family inorganic anion transporter [Xanthomonas arboricola pv. pruni]MDN0270992.1 SulP family inorganic anion transporter [Xanthomonas arboricola pv. pruni]MDN0275333.1 SulP family inorganic anion transporter [Xanthomonas arboricola pv. pruni]MDN0283587.1 SulP family inorganic anion transporter [Xanthomonas arboricola pv. pruni]MDN0287554.1 SulP family inorganic anion transporter [Xanthomonas arboricola pv. pr